MDIEKLINYLTSGNIHIEYSNINGEEHLKVNGEEITPKDDEIKKFISTYKDNIEQLDDCLFLEAIEEAEKAIDIKELDDLLKKEHFTEEERIEVYTQINFMNEIIRKKLSDKITQLTKLFNQLAE